MMVSEVRVYIKFSFNTLLTIMATQLSKKRKDEHDAEEAINALDNTTFGYDRRKLSVEWARKKPQKP
nr:nucleotide-binding, alpha-beta plait [Tanacetum cinerariifolium]